MKTKTYTDDKQRKRYLRPEAVLLVSDSRSDTLPLMASGAGTGVNAGDDGHDDGEFDDDDGNGGKPFDFEDGDMEDPQFSDTKPAWRHL